ncbi:TPR repeat protein [Methylophaga lonarensis MPL]|uniref:TPR repeat protein n=1 Tax=Methylophaga lonarensis MPL TaxID=1286106 RepID=M7PV97_9GAMM|nr:tetratricopeptide repeat protein [Methylophaga lonarensis]EMR14369.1 TPR repeat protein [Methylophaga lonarensis MPL]
MNKFKKTVLASVLALAMVGCGSAEDSAANFVESGNTFLEDGNVERARVQYRNALQIDPRLAEPYYRLALIDEKSQNWRGMYANLSTAEALNPEYTEVLIKLGQMYLLSNVFDEAMKRAEQVLALEPDNIEGLALMATIYIRQENFGSASVELDKALALAPDDLNIRMLEVTLLNERGDRQRAMEAMEKLIDLHPDASPLYLQYLTMLEQRRRYEDMSKVYQKLAEMYPEERWVVQSHAQLLNGVLRRHDDAMQTLAAFVERNPDDVEAKLLHVGLARTVNSAQGVSLLDSYIEQYPNSTELRFARVEVLLADGRTEEVIQDLNRLIETEGQSELASMARVSLAGIRARAGDLDAANRLVNEVLGYSSDDVPALIMRARLSMQQQRLDDATTDLRLAIRNNPDSDEALVLLAQAYAMSGSQQLAADTFRRALTANPQNQAAALAVAETHVRNGDIERAEQVLTTAMLGSTDVNSLLQAQLQVRLAGQNWEGSREIIERLRQTGEVLPAEMALLSGQMHLGMQNYTSAIEEFELALSQEPGMISALQGLVNAHLALNQLDELLAYMNNHLEKNPDQIGAYGVKATLLRNQQDLEAAKATVQQGLSMRSDWVPGYSLLASLHIQGGDPEIAIDTYKRGLAEVPEDNMLTMQLASAYYTVGNYDAAKAAYEEVLSRNPDVEPVINNLAVMLLDNYGTDANKRRALEMVERFRDSDQPYFLDTYAWAQINAGNYQLAFPALSRAISLDSSVPVFHFHMAVLQHRMEDSSRAQEALNRAEQMAREANDQRLMQRIDKFKQETGI